MAPGDKRRAPARKINAAAAILAPEVIVKRTMRHLDELERSNYAETSALAAAQETQSANRTRTLISDKLPAGKRAKKKSTMAVRSALIYKKALSTLIDESGIAKLPPNIPTYLTAIAPPPREPPRMICSVCGDFGKYKCRKCAMPYCQLSCQGVHNETRCERRVI